VPRPTDQVAVLLPLAVGIVVLLLTIMIHALAVEATVNFVRRETRFGRAGASFGHGVIVVAVAVLLAFTAHLIEIAVWATVFVMCGEFPEFAMAFDHSAVNYTTLGYGNVVMSPAWRLLGPLEAADGMLMFGVTTALVFTVIQRLVRTRMPDLRE